MPRLPGSCLPSSDNKVTTDILYPDCTKPGVAGTVPIGIVSAHPVSIRQKTAVAHPPQAVPTRFIGREGTRRSGFPDPSQTAPI